MTEFEELFTKYVTREGSKEMLQYLQKSDFFAAPASAKFHNNFAGGLAEHSVNVYKRLKKILAENNETYSDETVAVVGLLHDVCKANFYAKDFRNVKDDNGAWVKKEVFAVREKYPFGHGEKSVFIIMSYMKITPDEALAINWHMGGFDDRVKGGSYSCSDAFDKCHLALYTYIADMEAAYLDEKRNSN